MQDPDNGGFGVLHYIIGISDLAIALRPKIFKFLRFLKTYCDLYLYTHGLKEYAIEALKFLDPNSKFLRDLSLDFYFEGNLIAPLSKNTPPSERSHMRKSIER